MANLDVILHPAFYVLYFGAKYWYLVLAIIGVVVSTIVILKKKKKQMEKGEDA